MSKLNNPFEQHIESNDFNINPLVDDGTHVPHHVLQPRLEEWFENLPPPLSNGQWDDDLDDMQKRLRHNLANEIIDRGLLGEFAEQLEHIDLETLTLLLQYPITLTMLSQDYFRQNGYPYGWENPDNTQTISPENDAPLPRHQQAITWLTKQVNHVKEWISSAIVTLKMKKPRI